MKKVTWSTSGRIHGTLDDKSTLCGHVFIGPNATVNSKLHIGKKKRHCRICFTSKTDFKSVWLE